MNHTLYEAPMKVDYRCCKAGDIQTIVIAQPCEGDNVYLISTVTPVV